MTTNVVKYLINKVYDIFNLMGLIYERFPQFTKPYKYIFTIKPKHK